MLDSWQMEHIAYSECGEYYHSDCIPEIETRAERLRAVRNGRAYYVSWWPCISEAVDWFNHRELRDVRAESRYSIHEEQAQLAYERRQELVAQTWQDFVLEQGPEHVGAALDEAEEWFDAGIPSWEALRIELIERLDADAVDITCVHCGEVIE